MVRWKTHNHCLNMKYPILLSALLLGLAACDKDDKDDDKTASQDGVDMPMSVVAPNPTTIREADLPPADTNASVVNFPQVLNPRLDKPTFQAPQGFVVSLYKADMPEARWLSIAPNGDVFVAQSGSNTIRVLRDTDNDGDADQMFTWASGGMLSRPHGMVFHNNSLYVGANGAVLKYSYTSGQTQASGNPTAVATIPGGGQHFTRNVLIQNDKMYVAIGSAVNAAVEDNPQRATIQQFNLDGTGRIPFGTGLRNPVGMDINPVTNELWTVVNERDGIGDELVPDYATSVRQGEFFGYPYVYLAPDNRDPRVPETSPDIARTRTPEVLFKAHAAALGITFYKGTAFPEEYRNDAYVTMRGSWNRQQGYGYKVVRIKMNAAGAPEGGYEDFITGWHLNKGSNQPPQVFGRPIGIVNAPDGSLLISDDAGGAIWRVRYKGV